MYGHKYKKLVCVLRPSAVCAEAEAQSDDLCWLFDSKKEEYEILIGEEIFHRPQMNLFVNYNVAIVGTLIKISLRAGSLGAHQFVFH